jgi:hypothetical protein
VNKKIRYAMGAVGAMPALAMIPGQLAAPAVHAGKTAATTGKTVRTVYARDTAAFATTSTTTTASSAISPNVGACTGNTGHHTKTSNVTVRFYTRLFPTENRTCVGTIKVTGSAFLETTAGGWVHNSGGTFCFFSANKTTTSHRCRAVFRNDNGFNARSPLQVVGFSSSFPGGIQTQTKAISTINASGHFRNNGF